jgi:hypothetical protein
MSKHTSKLLIAGLALVVLLPIGVFAASQSKDADQGYDSTGISLELPINRMQNIEKYLRQMYGTDLRVSDDTNPENTPTRIFEYPHRTDEVSKVVSDNIVKLLNDDSVDFKDKIVKDGTTENPWNCNALFSWYLYGGERFQRCGEQGSEVRVSDLGTFADRASSFMEGFTSGYVDVYDNTGYSNFIDTVMSDTGVFGGYLNDKASSIVFSF